MENYKDLVVWQKATELAVCVYNLTKNFPDGERFGLTSQMRRASVSIASNIAEGKLRGSKKEFRHFLYIAFGSGGELETQLEVAQRVLDLDKSSYEQVEVLLNEVMRMLNVMISKAGDTSD